MRKMTPYDSATNKGFKKSDHGVIYPSLSLVVLAYDLQ